LFELFSIGSNPFSPHPYFFPLFSPTPLLAQQTAGRFFSFSASQPNTLLAAQLSLSAHTAAASPHRPSRARSR
jgi:hypothetical protein